MFFYKHQLWPILSCFDAYICVHFYPAWCLADAYFWTQFYPIPYFWCLFTNSILRWCLGDAYFWTQFYPALMLISVKKTDAYKKKHVKHIKKFYVSDYHLCHPEELGILHITISYVQAMTNMWWQDGASWLFISMHPVCIVMHMLPYMSGSIIATILLMTWLGVSHDPTVSEQQAQRTIEQ